jgi:hypothetical protein
MSDRRNFLRKAGLVTGNVALLTFGGLTGLSKASAQGGGSNPDTTQDIINAAYTAEQLATTFYYLGLLAAQLDYLPNVSNPANLNYFQAALFQEYTHASIFASLGAVSIAGSTPMFYFPTGAFQNENTFFNVLDALETAFIGAYTAAVGSWAGDAPLAVSSTGSFTAPQLAKVAAQILGTEAEHRALGRVANNINPPNNLILERAPYTEVGSLKNLTGTAVGALAPFVTGGKGFTGPYAMPSKTHVLDMAAPYTKLTNPGIAAP